MNKVDLKPEIDTSEYPVGVIIARFQVHKLHEAHRLLIDRVCENHKKVILFLGVSEIENTRSNPLDFATRKVMIEELYKDKNIVILPLKDQRSDKTWSDYIDSMIQIPFGNLPAVIYGGRDSFIPYYKGKYKTAELTTTIFVSGTEVRREVSREIISSPDFRAGVIHATYAQRPVTYPTVDVVIKNESGDFLLCKKPGEDKYRFIGGFVLREDQSLESSVKRIVGNKCGSIEIGDLKYIGSQVINDWRYKKGESGIMTTLFEVKFLFGGITPSDEISELRWFKREELNLDLIMEEHKGLFLTYFK